MKTWRFALLLALAAFGSTHASEPVATTVRNEQGIELRAWYFAPDVAAASHPAVVMLHGCSGVFSYSKPNSTHSNLQKLFVEWGRRLSRAGYAALLIDSFTARGHDQNQCGNGSAGTNEVVDRAFDALAGYEALIARAAYRVDPNRVAVLGWSQGGSTTMSVLDISTWPAVFKMGIAFYPACGLQNAYGGVRGSTYAPYSPLHLVFGTDDPFYTSGYCQTRQQNAIELGSTEFKPMWAYLNADHSFDYCTATNSNCSTADVEAKASADPYVMQILGGL
ncbi:dienelactone hydrolase family protein [Lysobacter korlensis]|uniref:Dienelactone hydrolase family protein n=1 Tax=Lysobacter korlensis TaxID=553636 RepID=A0ABV6RRL1_9GAMM